MNTEILQVAVVKWGNKYDASIVNRMYRAIGKYRSQPVRFVCITDDENGGYDPEIIVKPFPTFSIDFESMKHGCRLKLAIFAPGMLEPSLSTIFFDLDTVILGDVTRIAEEQNANRGLFMLQNHYVQWWKLPAWIKRFAGEFYYFGNSSVVAFYPEDFHYIYEQFNVEIQNIQGETPKYLRSDERYMSKRAGNAIRVVSRHHATKFSEEFMAPFIVLEKLRKQLPWVKRRREGLVAITFVGDLMKPEFLLNFKRGDLIQQKKMKVIWEHENYANYFR